MKWHLEVRVLPSFPTRRSSDLEAGPLGEELRQPGRGEVEPRQAVRAVAQVEAPVEREGRADVGEAGVREEQDRKSTRLNSSHRCISYAVFCLKKKTT